MFAPVLVEKFADRHALAGEPGNIVRYQRIQFQLALRRLAVTELRASESSSNCSVVLPLEMNSRTYLRTVLRER